MRLLFERPDLCTCNHMLDVHQHYTHSTYCSKCGWDKCSKFRRMILLTIRRRSPAVD
jgi:hypothetical protein